MIKRLIYKHFKAVKEKQESKERDYTKVYFSPSSVNKCGRSLFYKKTEGEPSTPPSVHTYVKFWMGDIVHEGLQEILKEGGYWVEGEEFKEKEYEGLTWVYRHDGLIASKITKTLVEIKSTYMSGYNAVEKAPKEDHVKQLMMYMALEDIPRGELLYVGRDNGFMIEYIIRDGKVWRDDGIMDSEIMDCPKIDFDRLHKLKKAILEGSIPDRDYSISLKYAKGETKWAFTRDKIKYKSPWNCSYCDYKDKCWEEELKEIVNHKFFIDGKFLEK